MTSRKFLGVCVLSAMGLSLSGCGGGSGAPAVATNPYGQYGVNGVATQAFSCQTGMLQLRNAFGQPQCFQSSTIQQACAQLGGLVVQNNLCRKERLIQGTAQGHFRTNRDGSPDNIPLRVNTFAGEGVKVYGTIDSLTDDVIQWDAELVQNNIVLGSASGDTNRTADSANLSITSISTANMNTGTMVNGVYTNGVNGAYNGNGMYNSMPGSYPIAGSPYVNSYMPTTYPNANGVFTSGFYNQPSQATPNIMILQINYQGTIAVKLHASAISCEDGHGNSYPCQ